MSNFDVSVWWSPLPRAGNIDSFCSKLFQSNVKGQVKIPYEHKCHTNYGSGSRSGYERSWKVTQIKNSFPGMQYMIYSHFARRIQNSRPFCNLTPRKSMTEKGQVSLGSHNVKFSNWYFRVKNVCFWTSFISGFRKRHFYSCAMSINSQNCSLKNDVINGYGFWAIYVSQK